MVKRIGFVVCLIMGVAWSGLSSASSSSASGRQIAVPRDPSSVGYLNLTRRHPDGAEGLTEFAAEYSPAAALQRLDQIRGFLDSFKQLTARARGRLTESDLMRTANTSAEMQSIGFHNVPLVVEGTLLKQDYLLKQLEFELAQLRHVRGEVTDQELERTKGAYIEATRRFQFFWDTKRAVD